MTRCSSGELALLCPVTAGRWAVGLMCFMVQHLGGVMEQGHSMPALTFGQWLGAAVRCLLLAGQVGLVVGLLVVGVRCIGGCGGYAEVYVGPFWGLVAALVALVVLVRHNARLRRTDPQRLARVARWQWWWLGISYFLLLVAIS